MRHRNLRLIIVGGVMIVLAAGFFLFMMTVAPRSNDPVSMMRTVGEVCGVVGGLGLAMMVVGLIGRKV